MTVPTTPSPTDAFDSIARENIQLKQRIREVELERDALRQSADVAQRNLLAMANENAAAAGCRKVTAS